MKAKAGHVSVEVKDVSCRTEKRMDRRARKIKKTRRF
jgi:hypothetical protein